MKDKKEKFPHYEELEESTTYFPDSPESPYEMVNKYGTYEIQPTAEMIYIICTKLNESADYLLGLENEAGHKIYNNNGIHNGDVNFK